MRIDFLRNISERCLRVEAVREVNATMIDVDYMLKSQEVITVRVYQPAGNEYLLGCDIIDRVKRYGVQVIVGTVYTQVTASSVSYGQSININVLKSSKQYLYHLANGLELRV